VNRKGKGGRGGRGRVDLECALELSPELRLLALAVDEAVLLIIILLGVVALDRGAREVDRYHVEEVHESREVHLTTSLALSLGENRVNDVCVCSTLDRNRKLLVEKVVELVDAKLPALVKVVFDHAQFHHFECLLDDRRIVSVAEKCTIVPIRVHGPQIQKCQEFAKVECAVSCRRKSTSEYGDTRAGEEKSGGRFEGTKEGTRGEGE